MKTTQILGMKRMNPHARAYGLNIPFQSMCPKCAQVRPQRGFTRNSLLRLLSAQSQVETGVVVIDDGTQGRKAPVMIVAAGGVAPKAFER